jgi:hypothetical protein
MPGNANVADPTPSVDGPREDRSREALPGAPVPVVEEQGVEFYDTPGITTLDGYAVGEPGQRQVELSFVAQSDVLTYTPVCEGASEDGEPPDRSRLVGSITVNGHPLRGAKCRSSYDLPRSPSVRFGGSHEREARIWATYGVEAGARVEVVVELQAARDEPLNDADADADVVLGAAFWSVPDLRSHRMSESTYIDDVTEYGGVNYRYVTSVSASRKEGGVIAAPAHSTGEPVLLWWGADGSAGTFTGTTGDGLSRSRVMTRSSGAVPGGALFIGSGDTSRARVTARRLESATATLWIALYEPIR